MDLQQFFFYTVFIIVALSVFKGLSLRNQIFCTYRRRDKTKLKKWGKAIEGYRINFDNGWYYIDIKRCVLEFRWVGILPIWVRTLDFRFDSPMPLDPETFNNDWQTPEARKALDKTEDVKALNEGSKKALAPAGKVAGAFGGGLMPILMIGGLLITLYFVYQLSGKIDMVGQAMNVIQTQLQGLGQ